MAVCFAQLLSVAEGLVSLSSQHVHKNPSLVTRTSNDYI